MPRRIVTSGFGERPLETHRFSDGHQLIGEPSDDRPPGLVAGQEDIITIISIAGRLGEVLGARVGLLFNGMLHALLIQRHGRFDDGSVRDPLGKVEDHLTPKLLG